VAGTSLAGHFTNALGVAQALQAKDPLLGALFAIVLLDASIFGAAAVTLSTSYAFGDFFGLKPRCTAASATPRPSTPSSPPWSSSPPAWC
jgi:Mn2+/Fe2+ NRAMP family transporter